MVGVWENGVEFKISVMVIVLFTITSPPFVPVDFNCKILFCSVPFV